MSYTPPQGDAVIFDFNVQFAYTPPLGDAVVFNFTDFIFYRFFLVT